MIEEAAGLGKHRKRRRRAQLKLERTQENLDRALDVEREARTRLRPLKRQAEAAELHERLERQLLEARWELLRDALRARTAELAEAQSRAGAARAERDAVEASLQGVIAERGEAERALSERAERHDALSSRLYAARSAHDRLAMRGEQAASAGERLAGRLERDAAELAAIETSAQAEHPGEQGHGTRIAALESELAGIAERRELELQRELAGIEAELERQAGAVAAARAAVEQARGARAAADARAEQARKGLADAEREADRARREAARVGAELAAANQFLRSHPATADSAHPGATAPRALSSELRVQDGYELALAAALGGRLEAAVVEDVRGAQALLDGAGPEGATALIASREAPDARAERPVPAPGARPLLELLSGPPEVLALAARLLADAWVVERLEDLPDDFRGIAATRGGRVWFGSWGEVRQLAEGGSELLLARRNERDRLIAEVERAAGAEQAARVAVDAALELLREGEEARAGAEEALRAAEREAGDAAEVHERSQRLIERRRSEPGEGPLAVRQAELEGELAAERRQAEQLARAASRAARPGRAAAGPAARGPARGAARRAARRGDRGGARGGRGARAGARGRARDRPRGRRGDGARDCATARRARPRSRPRCAPPARPSPKPRSPLSGCATRPREVEAESASVAERLGVEPGDGAEARAEPPAEPLAPERLAELEGRVERLRRRREQLGPVNPLAQDEYAEAVAHVEELEGQRADLETALRELRTLIRDTDRQIEETFEATFEAAARNFEELVGDVFPGGSGRLRLVEDEQEPGGCSAARRSRAASATRRRSRRRRTRRPRRRAQAPRSSPAWRSRSRRRASRRSACRCSRAARSR